MSDSTVCSPRVFLLATSIMLSMATLHQIRSQAAEGPLRERFIYNSDGDNMFIHAPPPMQPADLYPYVDEIAAAGVTSFFISPNIGMMMNFPSRHAAMLGSNASADIRQQIDAEGVETAGTLSRAALNLRGLVNSGNDPLGLIIERSLQQGMETFISFRLNEVHGVDRPDLMPNRLLISEFWRQHPEWRIGKPGDALSPLYTEILGPRTSPIVAGWLPGGLDFAVSEVRRWRKNQLQECCERYPINGIELDFQRFPMYFQPGQERAHIETMTAWVRDIRKMTDVAGKKRGRPIRLSARILAKPEQNLGVGLDPVNWAKQGLVDFLVVSHYLRNDFELPIREYRELVPPQTPIYASVEVEPKAETYHRLAANLYRQGADGLVFFNYFTCRQNGREPDFDLLKQLGDRNVTRASSPPASKSQP